MMEAVFRLFEKVNGANVGGRKLYVVLDKHKYDEVSKFNTKNVVHPLMELEQVD
jgi:hypothetical protein